MLNRLEFSLLYKQPAPGIEDSQTLTHGMRDIGYETEWFSNSRVGIDDLQLSGVPVMKSRRR